MMPQHMANLSTNAANRAAVASAGAIPRLVGLSSSPSSELQKAVADALHVLGVTAADGAAAGAATSDRS
jgi:hypothetical protein